MSMLSRLRPGACAGPARACATCGELGLGDLERDQVRVLDIGLRRPTLDDVFLSLTGHATESDDPTTDSSETAEVTR